MPRNPKFINQLASYIEDTLGALGHTSEVAPSRIGNTKSFSLYAISYDFGNYTPLERQQFLWRIMETAMLEPEESERVKCIVTLTPDEAWPTDELEEVDG